MKATHVTSSNTSYPGNPAISPSTLTATDAASQRCISPACGASFDVGQILSGCPNCGSLMDVVYDWNRVNVPGNLREFESRWADRRNPIDLSGVWRFRELLPFAPESSIVTIGEGQTILQESETIARYTGMNPGRLFLQYEGLNPSGSFKDNGMTAASTHARLVGAKYAACASTGNTSASLAIFAGVTGQFRCVVFVGSGKIAYGKLSQALDFGATTLQIRGDFDDALSRVREVCEERAIYLCNSVNPFRIEGQKAIMYRVLESLNWEPPDWIIVPGGNLGNSSSFGKAFQELYELGLINRIPRMAIINATGANTLFRLHEQEGVRWNGGNPDHDSIGRFYDQMDAENRRAATVATAIEINRPVNLYKALRSLETCDGVVREVSDQDILDARARVGASGFGCEPASGAGVAGTRLLREQGIIAADDRVVCILTGHQLKDPDATVAYHCGDQEQLEQTSGHRDVHEARFQNKPVVVDNELEAILAALPDDLEE